MRMSKRTVPSPVQAKRLAYMWGDDKAARVAAPAYEQPTLKALVKRGWVVPNGKTGSYSSETSYAEHVISEAGIDALEDYLRKRRYERK